MAACCRWTTLRASVEACVAVQSLGLSQPTAVQALAIPRLLQGRSVAFAGATGTGKTMGFLLPVVEQLRAHERDHPAARSKGNPRALVLAPTRALAVQIGRVAKELSHHLRFRVTTVAGGELISKQHAKLLSGTDMIVATPERLLKVLDLSRSAGRSRKLTLRSVRHVVVDEADEMLLRGPASLPLHQLLRACPPPAPKRGGPSDAMVPQLAFASATLSAEVRHAIAKSWPHTEVLLSDCAHRAPSRLQHEMRHVVGDKMLELMSVLEKPSLDAPVRRTLVFCRGVQSVRAVQHAMQEAGFSVWGCHSQMPEATRREALACFAKENQRGPIHLVCSDTLARGLDFPLVDHVLNFDFPATLGLYIHRAGPRYTQWAHCLHCRPSIGYLKANSALLEGWLRRSPPHGPEEPPRAVHEPRGHPSILHLGCAGQCANCVLQARAVPRGWASRAR